MKLVIVLTLIAIALGVWAMLDGGNYDGRTLWAQIIAGAAAGRLVGIGIVGHRRRVVERERERQAADRRG